MTARLVNLSGIDGVERALFSDGFSVELPRWVHIEFRDAHQWADGFSEVAKYRIVDECWKENRQRGLLVPADCDREQFLEALRVLEICREQEISEVEAMGL